MIIERIRRHACAVRALASQYVFTKSRKGSPGPLNLEFGIHGAPLPQAAAAVCSVRPAAAAAGGGAAVSMAHTTCDRRALVAHPPPPRPLLVLLVACDVFSLPPPALVAHLLKAQHGRLYSVVILIRHPARRHGARAQFWRGATSATGHWSAQATRRARRAGKMVSSFGFGTHNPQLVVLWCAGWLLFVG